VLAAALYVAVAARLMLGMGGVKSLVVIPLPLLLVPPLLVWRGRLSPMKSAAVWAAIMTLAAIVAGFAIASQPFVAYLGPALAVGVLLATRRPAATVVTVAVCSGAFGSLQALAHVPAAKLADFCLVGLWLSWLIMWYFRPRASVVTPALVALACYLLFTAGEILVAPDMNAAFQSYRGAFWYMSVVVLLAGADWKPKQRERMLRGMAIVGLLVGAYATLRWATGPAGAERQLALSSGNNLLNGKLRPIGSFATSKELAAWMAMFLPFMVGLALAWRGRWRLIALAAAGACAVGMLAADVRAGPAAAVPGVAVAIVLYQLSQGFRGRRGFTVLFTTIAAAIGGVGAYVVTIGGKPDSAHRYSSILHPSNDPSYQARLAKWRTAINDIDNAPLGHGLGTAGRSQKRFGQTQNIANYDLDNSYLTIAYQQGFAVMVLIAAILLLLLGTLLKRAVVELDPARAGPAIAAAGSLVAMLVIFYVGDYFEGLPALGGWVLVGLGLGQVTRARAAPAA